MGYCLQTLYYNKYVNGKLSPDVILDNVRDSLQGSIQRIHLLNKADISNIEHSFRLNKVQRNSDDATSVKLLLKELDDLGDANPVVHCKFQGEDQGDQLNNIAKDDMFLVIQHPLQLEMMKKFGGRGICVDVSHGTNGYDFYLLSVLVVDEFGEGFPCAWLISNREDESVLTEFFKFLHVRTGDLTPPWLMSDDAEPYYQSWTSV